MIFLNTNYIVGAVRSGTRQAAQIDAWELSGERLRVSAMAWAEFLCGPLAPAEIGAATSLLGTPVPIEAADAVRGAYLFNLAGRRRGSLADCIIAAVALCAGASLATDDKADFAPFVAAGLRVVP